jgi:hypothetical protein
MGAWDGDSMGSAGDAEFSGFVLGRGEIMGVEVIIGSGEGAEVSSEAVLGAGLGVGAVVGDGVGSSSATTVSVYDSEILCHESGIPISLAIEYFPVAVIIIVSPGLFDSLIFTLTLPSLS